MHTGERRGGHRFGPGRRFQAGPYVVGERAQLHHRAERKGIACLEDVIRTTH